MYLIVGIFGIKLQFSLKKLIAPSAGFQFQIVTIGDDEVKRARLSARVITAGASHDQRP